MKAFCLYMTVAFALMAVACGCSNAQPSGADTTPAQQAGGAAIEPEQLICAQEAAQILDEAVNPGENTDNATVGQKICLYEAQDKNSSRSLQISLTQQAFMKNGNDTPESIYRTTKDAVDETADDLAVDGIGSEYFFGTPGLHILYRGYYIMIAAGNTSDADVQETLKRAGALACESLDAILDQ